MEQRMTARCRRPGAFLLPGTLYVCAVLLGPGCHRADEVRAFLREPRMPVSGAEYRVYPPDVIAISSQQITEINGLQQQVRPDGKINLPLIGEVEVAGRTPREISSKICLAAGQYYEREKVDATVQVVGYNSQKYYVFGQVAGPGPRAWTGCDTLLDALCTAQPTQLAWPQRIKLVRGRSPRKGGYLPIPKDKKKEARRAFKAQGKNKAGAEELTVNLMAMIKNGDLSHNILLQPDDVIYVPPNPFAAVGLALRQVLFPVQPVLETVRVPGEVRTAVSPSRPEE